MAQAKIHIGYKVNNGGSGTVTAIIILQAMESAQANISHANLKGLL
jgi:hypothetical protein